MKYSWKGHEDRNRHKKRIKRGAGKLGWFMSDMNRNIPTTWRWAHGDAKATATRTAITCIRKLVYDLNWQNISYHGATLYKYVTAYTMFNFVKVIELTLLQICVHTGYFSVIYFVQGNSVWWEVASALPQGPGHCCEDCHGAQCHANQRAHSHFLQSEWADEETMPVCQERAGQTTYSKLCNWFWLLNNRVHLSRGLISLYGWVSTGKVVLKLCGLSEQMKKPCQSAKKGLGKYVQ